MPLHESKQPAAGFSARSNHRDLTESKAATNLAKALIHHCTDRHSRRPFFVREGVDGIARKVAHVVAAHPLNVRKQDGLIFWRSVARCVFVVHHGSITAISRFGSRVRTILQIGPDFFSRPLAPESVTTNQRRVAP